MSESAIVRLATEADIDRCAGILLEVAVEHFDQDPDQFTYVLSPPTKSGATEYLRQGIEDGQLTFVVEHLGEVVGLARTRTIEEEAGSMTPEQKILRLSWLGVDPAHRSKGFGSLLLSAVEKAAASMGANQVRLNVSPGNPQAQALYEREGFRVIGHEMGKRPSINL